MIIFPFILLMITMLSLAYVLYPLYKHKSSVSALNVNTITIAISMVSTFIVVALYLYLGSFSIIQSEKYLNVDTARKYQNLMQEPEKIINTLKNRTQTHPQDRTAWYLLGRVYLGKQQYSQAVTALSQAVKLHDSIRYKMTYVQALFHLNANVLTDEAASIVNEVLKIAPRNSSALSILGHAAYKQKKYQKAIDYWQKILETEQADNPEYKMHEKMIALAKQMQNTQA